MHWRKIVVDGIEWRYHVGRSHVVARASGRSRVANFCELLGMNWSEIERARRKGYLDIEPHNIAEWLRTNPSPIRI